MPKKRPNWHFWAFWARPCWLIWCPVGGLASGCRVRALSRKTTIYFILFNFVTCLWVAVIAYVFGILLTQNDFYFKSLSLFTGIDCVYGLVLDSNQIVNIFEIFFVSIFFRIFFVSDFSSHLLTFWPLFPMIYLIFKMFDLFRSWPLQKRSKTKVKAL